ncbi:MAG: CotH kinase family protein [Myxococcota bacterium]
MLLILLAACAGEDPGDSPAPADDTGNTQVVDADTDTDADTDADSDTDTDTDADLAAYEALYDYDVLQQIRLTISAADQDLLRQDGGTYVPATFEHDGVVIEEVGVRIKGSSTLREWDGKPSLKVKLNEYVDGQLYGGCEMLTLNNMADDVTQAHEVLGYALLREGGQLAPRATFAQVWVRTDEAAEWEYRGLYTNLEQVDERFLRHRDIDDGGTLWEANDSSDFTATGLQHFELVWGEDDRSDLDDVREAIFSQDFWADANEVVDMDQFLRFWGWRIAIGDRDGYPYVLNDYFVYDDPADGRFDFSPWGIDESWDTGMTWDAVGGILGEKCTRDTTCVEGLYAATSDALAAYEAADPESLAQRLFDLTETAALDDTRRTWTIAEVEAGRTRLRHYAGLWPDMVRTRMGL